MLVACGGDGIAYDEELAERTRWVLTELYTEPFEQKMFGGLAFMVRGHMTVGLLGDDLMVRVGKDAREDALALPHTREVDFTGRPMTSLVMVSPPGTTDDADLQAWVQRGLDFTSGLAAK